MSSDTTPNMTVSVIIPAYNAAATIGACLDALNASTRSVEEIIVVDDGSHDNTFAIAEAKGAMVVRQKNAGAATARNTGARASRGDYLYFLDSDVVVEPDTIESMLDTARHYDVDLVVGRYSTNPINSTIAAHYKALADYVLYIPPGLRDTVYLDGQIGGGGDFITRQAFEACGGFSETIAGASIEREELYVRFYEKGFHSAANPMIKTRHHFPSLSTLLRNYVNRIHGTHILMSRRRPKFTYIRKGPFMVPPGLLFLALLSGLIAPSPYGIILAIIFVILAVVASWDFVREALKRKGPFMTCMLLPLHLFVLTFIACVSSISLVRIHLGLDRHEATVPPS